MFRSFYEILWSTVLASAIMSYLISILLYLMRQMGKPFSLFMPDVIVGTLLSGGIIGIMLGLLIFFFRRQPMLFVIAMCGLFMLFLTIVGVVFALQSGNVNSAWFNFIGSVVSFIQGASVAFVVLTAVNKYSDTLQKEAEA